MDMATHALVGLTLYQTRRSRFPQYQPALFWAAIVGSEMPDFDIVYRLEGSMTYLLNHRGITHSLPGVLILSALLAYLLRERYPDTNYKNVYAWALGASTIHVFLDALNTWGTRLLLPFSDRWLALDILPFLDVPLVLLGIAAFLAGYCYPLKSRSYALAALCLFSVYVGGRCLLHNHIIQQVHLQNAALPVQKINVLPTIHPLHWETVIETTSSVVFGDVDALSGHIRYTAWYPTHEDPLLSEISINTCVAQALPFFRYPALALHQESGKSAIVISDLYFDTNIHRRATFELGYDGSVVPKRKPLGRLAPIFQ